MVKKAGEENRALGHIMDAKTRLILVVIMSAVMVAMVALLVTWLNLGLRGDFLLQWLKAYLIAWPVAAATGFLVMPSARRLTERIVRRIEARR
jgi:Protein of unknown function (DUF2798)